MGRDGLIESVIVWAIAEGHVMGAGVHAHLHAVKSRRSATENDHQLCSRLADPRSVPRTVRFLLSLAAASLKGCFERLNAPRIFDNAQFRKWSVPIFLFNDNDARMHLL
jgi:hypothetical protein